MLPRRKAVGGGEGDTRCKHPTMQASRFTPAPWSWHSVHPAAAAYKNGAREGCLVHAVDGESCHLRSLKAANYQARVRHAAAAESITAPPVPCSCGSTSTTATLSLPRPA
jgi:hypothetical protein